MNDCQGVARGFLAVLVIVLLSVTGCDLAAGQEANQCGLPPAPGELAIIGRTNPSAEAGSVTIPELSLSSPITEGCFEFRDIVLPRDPMLLSFDIRARGFRPQIWANYIVLGAGSGGVHFTPTLHLGSELELINPCPSLLANPQTQSAAEQLHAALCAQLPRTGIATVEETGVVQYYVVALGLLGAVLVLAGAALPRR